MKNVYAAQQFVSAAIHRIVILFTIIFKRLTLLPIYNRVHYFPKHTEHKIILLPSCTSPTSHLHVRYILIIPDHYITAFALHRPNHTPRLMCHTCVSHANTTTSPRVTQHYNLLATTTQVFIVSDTDRFPRHAHVASTSLRALIAKHANQRPTKWAARAGVCYKKKRDMTRLKARQPALEDPSRLHCTSTPRLTTLALDTCY